MGRGGGGGGGGGLLGESAVISFSFCLVLTFSLLDFGIVVY